jgi:hypothetical protein
MSKEHMELSECRSAPTKPCDKKSAYDQSISITVCWKIGIALSLIVKLLHTDKDKDFMSVDDVL